MMRVRITYLLPLPILLLSACDPASQVAQHAIPEDTLVTVNGMPITEYDLKYRMVKDKNLGKDDPELERTTLDAIILQEVAAQQALALGHELDVNTVRQLKARQAEVDAIRRTRLSELYIEKELAPKAAATDEEVRAYFDENRDKLLLEFKVGRILRRTKEEIDDDYAAIQAGATFEEVAQRPFTGEAAKAVEPWVMNYLRWYQLPESWKGVVDKLEPGEVSGVIEGEDDRYWIVKMLDRREQEGRTFESLKERLKSQLSSEALHELRTKAREELLKSASIVYMDTEE